MSAKDLRARYNEEAAARGLPPMGHTDDRVEACKRLALLMAQPKSKTAAPAPTSAKPRGNAMVRTVIAEELCAIEYFELAQTGERIEVADALNHKRHLLISWGFSYRVILDRVKKRLKKPKLKSESLRVHAANIRAKKPGYEGAKLPDRRPHSRKGVKNESR
jgi:hypothetical protein